MQDLTQNPLPSGTSPYFDPEGVGATPAQHCTTHHNACDCREAKHAKEVAALRARVATLEAECVAWRTNVLRVHWRNVCETVASFEAFAHILEAREATGQIGGVA